MPRELLDAYPQATARYDEMLDGAGFGNLAVAPPEPRR
jgi:hypothetical protein